MLAKMICFQKLVKSLPVVLLFVLLQGFVSYTFAQLVLINVSPDKATMQVGDQEQFQAVGDEGNGNSVTLQNPQWSIDGGATLTPISYTCIVRADQPGTYTLTCREGGTMIDVSPANVVLNVGQPQQFTTTGKDQYGNKVTITNPVWTTTGGGTLSPSGTTCTYTATTGGSYTITCTENGTNIKGTADIKIVPATSVNDETFSPTEFLLMQNYPNPFNPTTTIEYAVKEPCRVVLNIYDISGCQVSILVNDYHQQGRYSVSFNTQNLPTGVYFYRIQMKDFMSVRKMVVMR